MPSIRLIQCPNCCESNLRREDGYFRCTICGSIFTVEEIKDIDERILQALGSKDQEYLGNARKLLNEELKADYPDPIAINNCCDSILRILPEDPIASMLKAFFRRNTHGKYYRDLLLSPSLVLNPYQKKVLYPYVIDQCELLEKEAVEAFLKRQGDNELLSRLEKALKRRELEADLYANVPRDVFVCYAQANLERITPILERLESQEGYRLWWSARNLPKNIEDYKSNIQRAISSCKVFLVFASSLSMASKDVQWELDVASKIVPKHRRIEYRIEDRENNAWFRHFFDGIQWIDGANKDEYRLLADRIYNALQEQPSNPGPAETIKPSIPEFEIVDGALVRYNGNRASVVIPEEVITIHPRAFASNDSIRDITFSSKLSSFAHDAFAGCKSLKAIHVHPSNQTYIEVCGLLYTKNQEELVFCPPGKKGKVSIARSVKTIRSNAFCSCPYIACISFPSRLREIQDRSITYCPSLKKVTYEGDESQWNSISIGDGNEALHKAVLICDIAKKRQKYKKRAAIIGAAVVFAAVIATSLSLLTKNVFIPNSIYQEGVSLINSGNYQEALDHLNGLGFSDSDSQILVAKAGLAFESGDYETGISRMYDAGGTVEIKYDSDGGTVTQGQKKQLYRHSAYVTASASKPGHTFIEWRQENFVISTKMNHYSAEVGLKACYEIIPYHISYNLNGGTLENPITDYTVLTAGFNIGTPTKRGYTFAGWSGSDIDGTQLEVTINTGSVGDRNYAANWTPNEYTITYNYGYGENGSQEVRYDEDYVLETPTRLGYIFKGWKKGNEPFNSGNWQSLEDIELTADWEAIEYAITYNVDGGINSPNNPSSFNVESDDIILQDPTRVGYTFVGWTSGEHIEPTKAVTIAKGSTGNRAFTAHWVPNEYVITYDYGYNNQIGNQKVTYGQSYELIDPSREGYEFLGWYKGQERIENGVWNQAGDASLTAHWSIVTYDIVYELDGGTNHPSNPSSYNVESPDITLFEPTKTGHEFLGWTRNNTEASNKNEVISSGSTGKLTFTAHWKACEYTLSLDYRGGTHEYTEQKITFGDTFELPDDSTKEGYSFAGWFDVDSGAQIQAGTWNWDHNLSVFAKWNPISYQITYVLNGGTNSNTNPSTYTIESEAITIANPTRPGYTFKGWDDGSGEARYSPTIASGSVGNRQYEATWAANQNTIVFHGNGATSGEMDSTAGYTDQMITLPANQYLKTGYHFVGWASSATGTAIYSDEGQMKVDVSAVIDLYACWAANSNTITFHSNGGGGSMNAQSMNTDQTGMLNSNGFVKDGYHFTGWSTTSSGVASYSDGASYTMGTDANYDLYATWAPNTYIITLDVNGGVCSSDSVTVTYDSAYSLPVPTRQGYHFAGWFLGADPLTTADGASIEVYSVSGDVAAAAHWSPNENTITLTNENEEIDIKGFSDSVIRLQKDAFSKEGSALLGWSETPGGELKYYNDDLYYVGTSANYRLYAVWEENNQTDYSEYTAINTAEELLSVLNGENGVQNQEGLYSDSQKYYLANNIDMGGAVISPKLEFSGIFDGRGHCVRNFFLEPNRISARYPASYIYANKYGYRYYFGLFAINAGTICSLTIDDYDCAFDFSTVPQPTTTDSTGIWHYTYSYIYFGSLCGVNSSMGIIQNCKTITPTRSYALTSGGMYYVGAVAAENEGTISDCISGFALSFSGKLRSAYNHGVYTDNGFYHGAIVGHSTGTVDNCSAINSSIVSVKTDQKNKDNNYYVETPYVYVGIFCGEGNVSDCSEYEDLSSITNVVKFIFEGRAYYQFVDGSARFVLDSNSFVKEGYRFVGWALQENGPIQYTNNAECFIPFGQKKLELYAAFEPAID